MSVQIRERKLADGSRSLYLDVYEKGTRKRVATGLRYASRSEKAFAYQRAHEMQLHQEQLLARSSNGMTLADYMERICHDTKTPLWGTVINRVKNLPDISLSAITFEWVQALKREWKSTYKANTAHTYFNKVLYSIRCAFDEGLIPRNPAIIVKSIPKIDTEKVFLDQQEIALLTHAQCPHREVKKAFLFALYSGLRLSDVEMLTSDALRANTLVVRQKKTGSIVHIRLPVQAIALLERTQGGRVFKLPSRTTIQRSISIWAKNAGLSKKITFHTARHTYATTLIHQGVDVFTVSKMLGHRDIKSTLVYAHAIPYRNDFAHTAPAIG